MACYEESGRQREIPPKCGPGKGRVGTHRKRSPAAQGGAPRRHERCQLLASPPPELGENKLLCKPPACGILLRQPTLSKPVGDPSSLLALPALRRHSPPSKPGGPLLDSSSSRLAGMRSGTKQQEHSSDRQGKTRVAADRDALQTGGPQVGAAWQPSATAGMGNRGSQWKGGQRHGTMGYVTSYPTGRAATATSSADHHLDVLTSGINVSSQPRGGTGPKNTLTGSKDFTERCWPRFSNVTATGRKAVISRESGLMLVLRHN